MSAAGPGRAAPATEDDARRELVAACRRLDPLGINQGKAGNLSMRWHRGGADGMLVTPSALPYEETTIDDLAWLPLGDGDEPRADGPRAPSSEWRMHRDIYRARPGAGGVVHVHAPYASTLACLARVQAEGIPAFHYMVAIAGGADIRCARYETFGTQALSDAALEALDGRTACLLANHGMIALGASLKAALALAVEVEALARMYWQALAVGGPALLGAEEMARVAAKFGAYRPG